MGFVLLLGFLLESVDEHLGILKFGLKLDKLFLHVLVFSEDFLAALLDLCQFFVFKFQRGDFKLKFLSLKRFFMRFFFFILEPLLVVHDFVLQLSDQAIVLLDLGVHV